jgi:sulfatase maturation enzyme AslB (radical SAM superfamily)
VYEVEINKPSLVNIGQFHSTWNPSTEGRWTLSLPLIDKTTSDGTFDEFKIRYYDIRFTNLCNMSCRTCGGWFSSSWYNEEVELFGPRDHPQFMYAGRDKDDMWNQMQEHIPYLEQIYFAGGEPLIMEEHYRILKELVSRKMFSVRLVYNTNFSKLNLKDENVLDYWKLFDSVGVGASLDAMGPRAEYIRKGTDWDQIVRNREQMLKITPRTDFYVSSTVSIYNVLHIADFHREWVERGLIKAQDWNINILQGPDRDAAPGLVGHRLLRRVGLAADVGRGRGLEVHGRLARKHCAVHTLWLQALQHGLQWRVRGGYCI